MNDNIKKVAQIMEWLYRNDGRYTSKTEWREKFNEMILDLFDIKDFQL